MVQTKLLYPARHRLFNVFLYDANRSKYLSTDTSFTAACPAPRTVASRLASIRHGLFRFLWQVSIIF